MIRTSHEIILYSDHASIFCATKLLILGRSSLIINLSLLPESSVAYGNLDFVGEKIRHRSLRESPEIDVCLRKITLRHVKCAHTHVHVQAFLVQENTLR